LIEDLSSLLLCDALWHLCITVAGPMAWNQLPMHIRAWSQSVPSRRH